MFNNYLMSFFYQNTQNRDSFFYPHEVVEYRKSDAENISQYYEKNKMGENEFLIMPNCSCLVYLEKKDNKVQKFCVTSIIKHAEADSDKWIYLRYDFDVKENPNLWTHTAPHLHIEIQKDKISEGMDITSDYLPSELRIPSHKVSKLLIFEILESVCKISNFKEWFDARLRYVKENEILNEHSPIIEKMTNNKDIVDLILENKENARDNIIKFNKDLFEQMNKNGYLDIEFDSEYEQIAKVFNFDAY